MHEAIRESALTGMMHEVTQNNEEKGWYESDRTFGDDVALLHSEVSEMLEAYRDYGFADMTSASCGPCHGDGRPHVCKPVGVGSEAADVLIRLLDTCGRRGIDLANEYEKKMAYNKTRPYRHGGKTL